MIYIKIIIAVIVLVLLLGWVLPYLMSSKSNELPLIGIVIMIITPILLYLTFKSKKS